MANLRNSKNISVFRISLFLVVSLYFDNIYLKILLALYLLFDNYKDFLLFIVFLLISFLIKRYIFDFIPIGIVDYKNYNYYVVDKFLYKVKVFSENELVPGDILHFSSSYKIIDNIALTKKNILFNTDKYEIIDNFFIRSFISNRINTLTDKSKDVLNGILFHQYNYDDLSFNIGFGLYSYYFLNIVKKKSKKLCLVSIVFISIIFCFEIKYLLIIIDIIFASKDRRDRLAFKLIYICLFNFDLIRNYSILLPLLFSLIGILESKFDFKTYLLFIESICFGEINIIETIFFNKLMEIKIYLFILSLLLLFVPILEPVYLLIINVYSFINNLNISIRGSISIFSIIIFILINKRFSINKYLNYLLICLLIICPLNNPFTNLCFVDVGQGDSTLIYYPLNKKCVLIDTGSTFNYYKLKNTLYKKGIYKIDYLIISHNDSDHNGNIDNLKNDFIVKEIVTIGKDIVVNNDLYKYLYLGDYDNDNDNSLVYLLELDNYSFIFTGDISRKIENKIVEKYGPLSIDFLKASHHGSITGSSSFFVGAILPKYAIISTSGQYNHPAVETIETYDKYLVKYLITKETGNIDLYFTKLFDVLKTAKNDFVIINKK